MMKACFQKKILEFKKPAGTSRGILYQKPSWFISLSDTENPLKKGIGECSIIPGLSVDDELQIKSVLTDICNKINTNEFDFVQTLSGFPAIQFALETALLDLQAKESKILFPSEFTKGKAGIPINGLIWMGNTVQMQEQIDAKLEAGFGCIKLKVGAINFEDEIQLLSNIRKRYSRSDIEIRIDANGAFQPDEAFEKLVRLAKLDLHSIEQPIKAGQLEEMAELCRKSPLPIALDEELFVKFPEKNKQKLIEFIRPQYLVLKPSMLGGFKETDKWINIANDLNIAWWITSALESNIGLNAISQWTFHLGVHAPQGLGTGSLYTNNITSPLEIKGDKIVYNSSLPWKFDFEN
jgi:o-succinylbenzoate synthase